ncbi:MAG TPA: hypothetical protein VES97_05125 [Solirubrobacteraceae bacterium]|nr:hypothetical protein [Solirubrobacteraceae bacterium]
MSSRLRKSPPALLAVLAVLALSACGDSHTKVTTGTYAGESGANAPYLNVGPLIYEVQLSRELNPFDTEDAAYLQGLGAAERRLGPGQEWFAVFVQVYNNSSAQLPAAQSLTIADSQGNAYFPVVPNQTNQLAYRAGTVPAKGQLPAPDSIADFGPTQGALLLYKIQIVSLDNRPLTLRIASPQNPTETASAELDV